MSDREYPLGAPRAEDERSLFEQILNGNDDGGSEGHQEQGQGEGEGEQGQGEQRREAEPPQRERDERGQFARRDEGKRSEQGDRLIPYGEMKNERGKRQVAEAKVSEAERRAAELEKRLNDQAAQIELLTRQQAMGRAPQQQQAEKPAKPQAPDRYTDPDAYDEHMLSLGEQRARAFYEQQAMQRVSLSFEEARARDPEAMNAAQRAALQLSPAEQQQIEQRLKLVADPAGYLMNWHKTQLARAEIGGDPNAYRERVRAELSNPETLMQDPAFAKAMTEYLRQQAGQGGPNGGPRATYTPMPTLNGARGGNARTGSPDAYDNSDRGVFEAAMRGDRR